MREPREGVKIYDVEPQEEIAPQSPTIEAGENLEYQGENREQLAELVARIKQVRGLPHEYTENQGVLRSWFDQQQSSRLGEETDKNSAFEAVGEPEGKDALNDQEARELAVFLTADFSKNSGKQTEGKVSSEAEAMVFIDDLAAGQNSAAHPEYIFHIASWLETLEAKKRHQAIVNIEKKVASVLAGQGNFGLSVAVFLGEMQQHKVANFVEDELVNILETKASLSRSLRDQLAVLNRLNDKSGNIILHKIIDFFQDHLETMQNDTPEQEAARPWNDESSGSSRSSSGDFENLVEQEIRNSRNYLVKKHWQDYFEMIHAFDKDKPGTVPGIAGGSSDQTIYTFQNLDDAYRNRLALGINEGWPIANPVLPVAPYYYGYYQNGRLAKVFHEPDVNYAAASEREAAYIARNHPEDEYIYDDLNEPLPLDPRRSYPSNKLQKLEAIWDFKKHLRQAGRKFFFDLAKIEHPEELHPIVWGDLMTHNQIYIQSEEGEKNTAQPVDQSEYSASLFPVGQVDAGKEYAYRYLMSLSMRKKVEDDLGVDMAEIPMFSQAQFLDFVSVNDIKEFSRLKTAIAGLPPEQSHEFLKSFLAVAYGNEYSERFG